MLLFTICLPVVLLTMSFTKNHPSRAVCLAALLTTFSKRAFTKLDRKRQLISNRACKADPFSANPHSPSHCSEQIDSPVIISRL